MNFESILLDSIELLDENDLLIQTTPDITQQLFQTVNLSTTVMTANSANNYYFLIMKIILFIIMLFVSFATAFGNLIVIICFIKFKTVRTNSNFYLLSLSAADLIVGLVCMPIYAYTSFVNGNWPFGVVLCRIWLIIDYVVGTASVLQIVFISLDRCISVVYPIKYRSWATRRIIFVNIFLVWLIAFLNYGPAIIFWPILEKFIKKDNNTNTVDYNFTKNNHYECRADFRDNFYYLLVTASIEFFIPFVSVSVLNFLIYWNIHKRVIKSQLIYQTCSSTQSFRNISLRSNYSERGGSPANSGLSPVHNSKRAASVSYIERVASPAYSERGVSPIASLRGERDKDQYLNVSGSDTSNFRQSKRDPHTQKFPKVPVITLDLCSSNHFSQDLYELQEVDETIEVKKIEKNIITMSDNHLNSGRRRSVPNSLTLASLDVKYFHDSNETLKLKPADSYSLLRYQINKSKKFPNTFKDNHLNKSKSENFAEKRHRSGRFHIPTPEELFENLEKRRNKNLERDKKISRSLALLVIVFFICWCPYTLIALIDAICISRTSQSCINSTLFEFVFWLLWINSSINPLLYPFVQKTFRNAYKSMFNSFINSFKSKIYN